MAERLVRDGDSCNGRPYRDPWTHSWTLSSSMRRRHTRAHDKLTRLASSNGRPVIARPL
ncbi:unnamed protein product [Staurois parvus]|uniref:Uncharacterized protein n=1 Tax=Staurois parvus TaxID=386267 RepID=A0ABN9CL26_9NEOB|nr:unnamed protein product [Staurois parvus]